MTDLIGQHLGQYQITGVLGQGGMATVYRARQPSMDREVAIKVISSQLAGDPGFVARFEREARMIARLQHVYILPVYDFGREGDLIYLVMRLVEGGSLDERLRQGLLHPAEAIDLFTKIASALTYAHREGVVHRDLKPGNILLDNNGDPYLTDFGLAKLLEGSPSLTASGVALGTPSYMAPEQWRGEEIDARADIYALGIMLYEMLTGQLPFKAESPSILMYKHLDETPALPSSLNPDVSPATSAVIMKALEKDPANRFASADSMAVALKAAAAGTPILTAAAPDTVQFSQAIDKDRGNTLSNQVAPVLSRRTSAISRLLKNPRALVAALAVLCLILVGGVYALTNRSPYQPLMKLTGHTGWVNDVAWSPDSRTLASAGEDQTVRLWNATTGDLLTILRGHTDTVSAVSWSPNGSQIASASEDNTIRIWDFTSGKPLAVLADQSNPSASNKAAVLAWNPDGKRLAAGITDGTAQIWNVPDHKLLVTVQTQAESYAAVAWNPDGSKLATVAKDNAIQIIDPSTGESLLTFPAHTRPIFALQWTQDGSRLVSASLDDTVRIWDMLAKQPLTLLVIRAHDGGISSAMLNPDGRTLVTCSGFINLGGINDLSVRLWEVETGKLLTSFQMDTLPPRKTIWSPDGNRLAVAGLDGTVRVGVK